MSININNIVEQVFNENKLIGNHDFTDDEYSWMVDYVSDLSYRLIFGYIDNIDKIDYKLIFATLVEIAKRWKDTDIVEDSEENSGFWCFIFKILISENECNQKLYSAFTSLISQMGSQNILSIVKTGKKYYATIMMHSFSPKNSIHSFFDLCYNVFKKDFDFGFTSDDEWQCEEVAKKIAFFLGHGYREDKKVSIGSSAYSIKIGLRSFALNEGLYYDFVKFIKDTFYQINKLFNREKISEDTRLERYIVEWWKNKTELEKLPDDTARKKRVLTVSKQNIVAKFIRFNTEVFLCIPSIRLDNDTNIMRLLVYVEEEQVYSEEMRTSRGELVVATKQKEFELNDLLKRCNSVNIRIEITENGVLIFDSEKNKATSVNREFILFDGEKEVFSQINKPTNYFIYSKDIDSLKSAPAELTTCSNNLYNIYPKAGESIKGETKQVFFANKEKVARLGKSACLIGNFTDVEWLLDDVSCAVYGNNVKLMIPGNLNLKALELRVDRKSYKLHNLKYEQFENDCYQYELKASGLIAENELIEVTLYSYEIEESLLSETIIVLPSLDIQFNKSFYYGDIERKATITTYNDSKELSWTNQDNEIKCPLNEGVLLIKIPYFRWRINGKEWHNEPINRKLWYKDILVNGDLLEIDYPKEDEEIKIYVKADGIPLEIFKNQNGRFEIGRAIYANEGLKDICVYCSILGQDLDLFNVSAKEHFIDNPLIYRSGKVYWDVENTFIGEKHNDFFLILKGEGNNEIRRKIGGENEELNEIQEDLYNIRVKIKDINIFSREERFHLIYEGELIVGKPEKFRYKNKRLFLKKANCRSYHDDESYNFWITFISDYFLDNLEFVEEGENIYYRGRLCVIDQCGETVVLNTMENENKSYDEINPVRIELRDYSTLWLVAGWQGGHDFLGNLFCDIKSKDICNIAQKGTMSREIILYKFEEVDHI